MFIRDLQNNQLASQLIVGIYAKKDINNKVATGSSMSFGWYDKSYDFVK